MTPHRLAARYLGLAEIPGSIHHPLIQWWLLKAGLPLGSSDETPWCASFVHAMCWELAVENLPAFPARARRWLTVGNVVEMRDARPGWDVVVLKRGGANEPGPQIIDAPGHVGFYLVHDSTTVTVLGGNQGDRVSVAKFPLSQVLGVRRLGAGEV